eukprot:TRINITY_DN55630_c0_g1_i1.p1 TRINITY_DN55630_c0_g1~~TRINITY_DN55630_c0_g1_i1.p1  ORF type:complete len:726 (-),score=43.96 TRINITY_DN55630_c0_g1_i1:879-3056(-)
MNVRLDRPAYDNADTLALINSFTSAEASGYLDKFYPDLFYLSSVYLETHATARQWTYVPPITKPKTTREAIFLTFDEPQSSTAARWISIVLMALVLLSQLAFLIETLPKFNSEIFPEWETFWLMVEIFFTIVFSAELLIRLVTHPRPTRFFLNPLNVVDLVAIIPFFLELMYNEGGDVRMVRIMRVVRVVRLLKLMRGMGTLRGILVTVVKKSGPPILFPFFVFIIGNFIAGAILYWVEGGTYDEDVEEILIGDALCEATPLFLLGGRGCPKIPTNFISVLECVYWCLDTSLVVGDQGFSPQTRLGRFLVVFILAIGLGGVAMPLAIVGHNFSATVNSYIDSRDWAFKTKKKAQLLSQNSARGGSAQLNLLLIERQLEELLFDWSTMLTPLSQTNPKLYRHVKYFLQMCLHYMLTSSEEEMMDNIDDYNKLINTRGIKEIDLLNHVLNSAAAVGRSFSVISTTTAAFTSEAESDTPNPLHKTESVRSIRSVEFKPKVDVYGEGDVVPGTPDPSPPPQQVIFQPIKEMKPDDRQLFPTPRSQMSETSPFMGEGIIFTPGLDGFPIPLESDSDFEQQKARARIKASQLPNFAEKQSTNTVTEKTSTTKTGNTTVRTAENLLLEDDSRLLGEFVESEDGSSDSVTSATLNVSLANSATEHEPLSAPMPLPVITAVNSPNKAPKKGWFQRKFKPQAEETPKTKRPANLPPLDLTGVGAGQPAVLELQPH